MERFVAQSLKEMTDAMLSGAVEPDPLIRGPMASSCQYCDYQSACHQDLCAIHKRYIAAVKPERFWQEVERRLDHAVHTDEGPTGGR